MKKKYYRKRDNNFYLDKTKEEILSEIVKVENDYAKAVAI